MDKFIFRMSIGQSEESTESLLKKLAKETDEEKAEREKINIEIEELAKQLEAKNLLDKKKNITVSIIDSSRIKYLELSIKNGVFANNSIYGDCKTELFGIGHTYLSRLIEEFDDNTDNAIKFENDFNIAVENTPLISLQRFKDDEIDRLTDIKNLILKCSGSSEFYRSFNLYFVMCSYLEFLQQPYFEYKLQGFIPFMSRDVYLLSKKGIPIISLLALKLSELDGKKVSKKIVIDKIQNGLIPLSIARNTVIEYANNVFCILDIPIVKF